MALWCFLEHAKFTPTLYRAFVLAVPLLDPLTTNLSNYLVPFSNHHIQVIFTVVSLLRYFVYLFVSIH